MSSSSAGTSFSAMTARAGCRGESSKAAVTCPCSAPWRTRTASPRAPSASAKASSRMDLPAPVSPVSTDKPDAKSISSRSIRTMSRIESRASMTIVLALPAASADVCRMLRRRPPMIEQRQRNWTVDNHALWGGASWVVPTCGVKSARYGRSDCVELQLARGPSRERLTDPMALVLVGLKTLRLHQGIGVLVPTAVREIVAQHRCRGLRFLHNAERHVGFGKPQQRFLDVARALIARHHDLEAIDGANIVAGVQVLPADLHLLA